MTKNAVTQAVKKQAADRIAALAASLQDGESAELMACLKQMSRFHRYSITNTMLIYTQCPSATRVAGFRQWKRLGRWVKSGEKGIKILVPYISKMQDDEDEDSRVVWFGVGHVFDISQTDGQPLVDINRPTGDPGPALDRLRSIVRGDGISLSEGVADLGAAKARARRDLIGDRYFIDVKPDCSDAEAFALIVHELAHIRLHLAPDAEPIGTQTKEAEAEAVAYVVCSAAGLDTSLSAKDYLQSWQVDTDLLSASLTRIQEAATDIITKLTETADAAEAA